MKYKFGDNIFIIWLWSFVWQHWLKDYNVIIVKGWRTAIVEDKRWKGNRTTISPCFWIFQ